MHSVFEIFPRIPVNVLSVLSLEQIQGDLRTIDLLPLEGLVRTSDVLENLKIRRNRK